MPKLDIEADEITFSFPLLARICAGGLGLFFLALTFYEAWLRLKEGGDAIGWRGAFSLSLGLLLSGLLIWLARPRDVVIEVKNHTYRLRQGWPLLARWQTGDVSDMASLTVRRRMTKGGETYFLLVKWRAPDRRATMLGEYKEEETALRHCRRLAERLGIEAEVAVPT